MIDNSIIDRKKLIYELESEKKTFLSSISVNVGEEHRRVDFGFSFFGGCGYGLKN